jgi:hypothetical protein
MASVTEIIYRRWDHRWNDTVIKVDVLGGKSVRIPLCQP